MWQAVNESISRLCSSPFWDTDVTWNSLDPDFTICFQKTILVWIPCLFLWLFLPIEIHYLRHTKAFCIPYGSYNVTKLTLIAAMVSLTAINVTRGIVFGENHVSAVDINSGSIKFFTFCLFFVLTYANIQCGIRSSGVLFMFSLLLAILGAPEFRSTLRSRCNIGSPEYLEYIIFYLIVLAILLLNCFTDARPTVRTFLVEKNVCPENDSSFPSRIFFAWFDTFVWKGYVKPLEEDDLWSLEDDLKSATIVHRFESKWFPARKHPTKIITAYGIESGRNEDHNSVASIFRPLCKTFGPYFMFGFVLKTIADCLAFVDPQILKAIITFVDDSKSEYLWRSYLYAIVFFVVATLKTLFSVHYTHVASRIGLQIHAALVSVIYKKTLKLSNCARKSFTIGEVVNLMAVDLQRFVELMSNIDSLWSVPLQISLALYFLWRILGPSVLAGLAVMLLLVPLNGLITFKIKNLQIEQMRNKDKRVRLINEILCSIKVLKLYAWESSFEKRVARIRDKEIAMMKKEAYLTTINAFVWTCAPFLVSLISFAAYVLSSDENVLDAETAFVSLSIFNILRVPLYSLPFLIKSIAQTFVSVKRIDRFLNSEELDPSAVSHQTRPESIIVENGDFSWDGYDAPSILRNINVKVKPGNLVAVVGAVAAGKSSLLAAMLGEMYKQSGFVNTTGRVAYVPQQAWIRNVTLKQNMTMGKTVERSFYRDVLDACALTADLQTLPAGDDTEIGEKGINLSGGQKQRISLARAVFSDADIYLLDDPFSAVDSHVGKHIFDRVIGPSGLLNEKTRVMVTHNITYLSQVDLIIVLENGVISESGTYAEFSERGDDVAKYLATNAKEEKDHDVIGVDTKVDIISSGQNAVQRRSRIDSGSAALPFVSRQTSSTSEYDSDDKCKLDVVGQKLIKVEKTESGNIKWKVCASYFAAIGSVLTSLTILTDVLSGVLLVASKYWLTVWTSDNSAAIDGRPNTAKTNTYLSVYGLLGFLQVIAVVLMTLASNLGVLRAAKRLHDDLLGKLMRWPLFVFDCTPVGRILNRFTGDLDILDEEMPDTLWNLLYLGSEIICILSVISYTTPWFTTVIVPMGLVYFFVQVDVQKCDKRFYIATSRQLKRLESVSRSPIYSHFGETISGVQSIRAYNLEKKFIRASENKVDENQKSYYTNLISYRWISLRLQILGNLMIFFSILFATQSKDSLTAGLVGLSLSYALEVTDTLNWLFTTLSQMETNIVAVERIIEYGEIAQEAPWQSVADEHLSDDWPHRGDILFDEVQARHREGLELVLEGITFRVNGGEKVGIVGRTGAGKSSLTLSLFRIIESCGGRIVIDNVDISTIGLHKLRKKLTIIPQDPVLFSGTLRMNLDPAAEYSDESLWRALQLADLKTYVSTLNLGLQYEVSEGGENFSVGQRQLLCLARALLRKTKVLVLDEATAAIDLETDDVIQATIRKEFIDCTVLTIAHRLNTIMDYDRILVLDQGRVVEFGSPASLLESKSSNFYQMAADAGLV